MKRIRLIPIDENVRRFVDAPSEGFREAYGARLGDNLVVVREVVQETLTLLDQVRRPVEWGGFLAVDDERGLVVGSCGFKHGPDAGGAVEIAYFTFPEFEGQGYATRMAAELLERAVRSGRVRRVVAHTLPERNASTRILEKLGLRPVGEVLESDVGRAWRWVYEVDG